MSWEEIADDDEEEENVRGIVLLSGAVKYIYTVYYSICVAFWLDVYSYPVHESVLEPL